MRFDIFTIFPGLFESPLKESMIKRAIEAGLLEVYLHDIRAYTSDKHHTTDDYPYGGGGGMVMKPEPVFAAVEAVLEIRDQDSEIRDQRLEITHGPANSGRDSTGVPRSQRLPMVPRTAGEIRDQRSEIQDAAVSGTANLQSPISNIPVILLTPQGRVFNQRIAMELAQHDRVGLICGRYEGFDERIREYLATDEISIGDYVLTGGELAALVILDAVIRLKPGVLGDPTGALDDSHASGLLEYPHYTRPPEFRGWRVPEVLLSGNHAEIERWRREQALRGTWERRPDLLARVELTDSERAFLDRLR